MKFVVFVVLFLCSFALGQTERPRTHLFVIAGGGEPDGPTTIFDSAMVNLAKFATPNKFEKRIYFNGGHAQAEKRLSEALRYKPNTLTTANYNLQVQNYINDLRSGKIKKGEKMMIVINSHGSPKEGRALAHKVSSADRPFDGTIDLAKLKAVRDLANANGVQLAIVDLSCYSGNIQDLSNDNTCVISSAGKDQVAWLSFGDLFTGHLLGSENLHVAFMRALWEYPGPSMPQINSPAGKVVAEDLKRFEFISGTTRDFSSELRRTCEGDTRKIHVLQAQTQAAIDQLTKTCATGNSPICVEAIQLRRKTRDYISFMNEVKKYINIGNNIEQINVPSGISTQFYTWKNLAWNLDELEDLNKKFLENDTLTDGTKKIFEDRLKIVRAGKVLREQLIESEPKFVDYIKNSQPFMENHYDYGEDINAHLHKLQKNLLIQYSHTETGANPCRDFSL